MSSSRRGQSLDLLRLPILGRFLGWRHARTTLQLVLLGVAILVVLVPLFVTLLPTMTVREEPLRESPDTPIKPRVTRIVLLTLIFVVATTGFGGLVGLVGALLGASGGLQLVAIGLAGLVAIAGAIVEVSG